MPVRRLPRGADLLLRATVSGPSEIKTVRAVLSDARGNVSHADMERTAPLLYQARLPAAREGEAPAEPRLSDGMSYFLEATDVDGRRATWPAEGQAKPVRVSITDDHDPPALAHEPIRSAPAGKPLTVRAEVRDPSGVKWVRLRYRSVTQFQDYRTLPMVPTGRSDVFEAVVPAEHVDPKWDFMSFFEVMDNCGNGRIYPDLERETPYIVVKLQRDK